ncbi:MAG: hypothetical protein M5R42_14755 [Rhodocyclaceae bacterium]|nr:hypothetical protein [Rhodocyclaceae bacterium]
MPAPSPMRERFFCAWTPGGELAALKAKLDAFNGGDLVMTLPPPPYRCQPAPYERALVIGRMIKRRGLRARLQARPGHPAAALCRGLRGRLQGPDRALLAREGQGARSLGKTISTEFDDLRFDDAILMPPQQAGDLAWQAGLIGRDAEGRPSGWAAQDPLHLHAQGDERVFLVGDLIDRASLLFGHYPKSGHLASRLGAIAAHEIAARSRDKAPETLLPESSCFIYSKLEPAELTRIDTHYRLRGDGLIVQGTNQHHDPNPRGEDVAWAKGMFGEMLAYKP